MFGSDGNSVKRDFLKFFSEEDWVADQKLQVGCGTSLSTNLFLLVKMDIARNIATSSCIHIHRLQTPPREC
jgi:hypothetical protein